MAGAECRAKQDVCDLPEYCNGSTAYCPDDVYIMNGYPCSNSKAYCYYGVCQSFDSQCESIYGKGMVSISCEPICRLLRVISNLCFYFCCFSDTLLRVTGFFFAQEHEKHLTYALKKQILKEIGLETVE